jgi:hypothetical protein
MKLTDDSLCYCGHPLSDHRATKLGPGGCEATIDDGLDAEELCPCISFEHDEETEREREENR